MVAWLYLISKEIKGRYVHVAGYRQYSIVQAYSSIHACKVRVENGRLRVRVRVRVR